MANRKRDLSPAERAVINAGYDFKTFAKRLNRNHRYVRELLRNGGFTLFLGDKAARLCKCSGNVFYHPTSYTESLEKAAVENAGSLGHAPESGGGSNGVAAPSRRLPRHRRVPILRLI